MLTVVVLASLVGACAGGGAGRASFAVLADLEPSSSCVTDPDPLNGGRADAPADVAAEPPIDPAGVVSIEVVGLGDIVLPSDRLLVGDFFALTASSVPDLLDITLNAAGGRAPVCLHVARLEPADQRVAYLHVRASDDPVVAWHGGNQGSGVDGGTGGIGSPEALRATAGRETASVEAYLASLEANVIESWGWANITTDPATGANVIGFSTGYGDGGYPVYTGVTRDGRVAAVVIDFLVLPWDWLGSVGPVRD